MIAIEESVIDAVVEAHRPDVRTTDFGAGWNAHRRHEPRAGVFRGRVYSPVFHDGWDARHRLACAAAAGVIGWPR